MALAEGIYKIELLLRGVDGGGRFTHKIWPQTLTGCEPNPPPTGNDFRIICGVGTAGDPSFFKINKVDDSFYNLNWSNSIGGPFSLCKGTVHQYWATDPHITKITIKKNEVQDNYNGAPTYTIGASSPGTPFGTPGAPLILTGGWHQGNTSGFNGPDLNLGYTPLSQVARMEKRFTITPVTSPQPHASSQPHVSPHVSPHASSQPHVSP